MASKSADSAGGHRSDPSVGRRSVLQASAAALASAVTLGAGTSAASASAAGTSAGTAAGAPNAAGGPLFEVDLSARGTPLRHFWEGCIRADHAKQALRRHFQDQLTMPRRDLG